MNILLYYFSIFIHCYFGFIRKYPQQHGTARLGRFQATTIATHIILSKCALLLVLLTFRYQRIILCFSLYAISFGTCGIPLEFIIIIIILLWYSFRERCACLPIVSHFRTVYSF